MILTEEHEPLVRERNVQWATLPNKISLMTKSFGRGTDFQVLDKIIKEFKEWLQIMAVPKVSVNQE